MSTREIVVSMSGHDIAGLLRLPTSVVFYSADKRFRVHMTAHNPNPAEGYESGGLHARAEGSIDDDAAAAEFIAPLFGETFERTLDDLARSVTLGTLIAHTDAEELSRYRGDARRRRRLALPASNGIIVSAWLFRAGEMWDAAGLFEPCQWSIVDTNGPTWMALLVSDIDQAANQIDPDGGAE